MRHFLEGILALGLVQAITGADQCELLRVDAAVSRGILQVEHEVHVFGLPVHDAAGILSVGVPHVAPLVDGNLPRHKVLVANVPTIL